jgi:uncharacterized protein (DUF1501 family)
MTNSSYSNKMNPSRRSFLGTAIAGLGLGLGGLASRVALGGGAAPGAAKHCIVLYMSGGASHIDTFDPKGDRDTGGKFSTIATKGKVARISEHLPGIAKRMDKLALIRSLTAKEGNHKRARYLMHTGFVRQGAVSHPGIGSHVARTHEIASLPAYVALGAPGHAPGYLGAQHAAYSVLDPRKAVRNLRAPDDIDADRRAAREGMWRALEDRFAAEHPGQQVEGHRAIGERALAMSRASQVDAFDLERESAATRARYGETRFGAGCLMARRLVEVGVPFVEVSMKGWDTHQNVFDEVQGLSGTLDRAVAALIDDLVANGKWSETLIVWMGDFGRTPKINDRGGRDHWPHASSVWMAGGMVRGGQVIGATDDQGARVVERPVQVADLFATMALALGVSSGEMHMTPRGRPVTTVDEAGTVIEGLLA